MYISILIPDFQLQTALRAADLPAERPAALLDEVAVATNKQRGRAPVLQATPAAIAYGICQGMTATQAQARCPHIALLYRNHEEETLAQADLLAHADSLCPDYESTAPGVVTLCTTHTKALQDMDAHLQSIYRRITHATRLVVRVGAAHDPDLAFLTACQADPVQAMTGDASAIRRQLAPLPISLIAPPPTIAQVLYLWGIRTVGDFTALPKADLIERLGPECSVLWDFASGQRQRLLRLVRPSVDFSLHREMDYALANVEPLLAILQDMLQPLLARLTSAWLVAEELCVSLRFDSGTQHERRIRIAQPNRDLPLLMRLLTTALDPGLHSRQADPSTGSGTALVTLQSLFPAGAGGITHVTLQVKPSRPTQAQTDLFQPSLRDPNRLAESIIRLETLFGGHSRVGSPLPSVTHQPDRAQLSTFQLSLRPAPTGTAKVPSCHTPYRRCRPPITVKVTLHHGIPISLHSPMIQGNIIDRRGPWYLSGDWWDARQRWAVEEWDIQLQSGDILRLSKKPPEDWEIEGLYS